MSQTKLEFLPSGQTHRGLLNWVIGIMVFLTGMSIVAGIQLGLMAEDWRLSAADSLTVQIIHPKPDQRDQQTKAALAVLNSTPGVASARAMNDGDMSALLAPWIGDTGLIEHLPVPQLVEVKLMPGAAIDLQALEALIVDSAPNAAIDTHEQWLDDLLALAQAAQLIALSVVVMMVVATIAIIVFTARSSLLAQQETVAVVHMLGATDNIIAGAFQQRFWGVGLRGGLIGLGLVALVIGGVYFFSLNVQSAYLPQVTFHATTVIILALLPLVTGFITMLTARRTVKRVLAEMV